ncbi:hypothetical protein [Halococcus sp. AFM35]|uniref:hypothetical protein n=1 Tax=Halococcus sp. AFM35 TaxID=3421653 RepID=UPI003EBECE96
MPDSDGDDHSEFVFGEERSADTDAAPGRASRRTIAAAVFFVVIVALVAIYPFASSAVTGLFGSSADGAGGANATAGPTNAAGETVGTEPTGEPAETNATMGTRVDTVTTTATRTPMATPTTTQTSDTPTATATPTATETPASAAPAIESFAVTDRSADGAARFDIGWNVTDADGDLVAVRATVVADPDGEARTVAQRRFDAGGAQSTGDTTFEVPEGSGAVYELSIEAVDTSGNTAFELTREVADGSPDG